jgi:hypothetical protein
MTPLPLPLPPLLASKTFHLLPLLPLNTIQPSSATGFFAFSRTVEEEVTFAVSARGGGDNKVGSISATFCFFTFSRVLTADAEGADC